MRFYTKERTGRFDGHSFGTGQGARFSRFLELAGDEGESQWQPPNLTRAFPNVPNPERNEMPTPSKTLKETEEALLLVIKSLIDGQEGLKKIAEELKDETLKRYFLAESLIRAEFRGELETVLHQEGVHDIKESGSISGTVLRTWGELKNKFGGGDHALLETAEQGEDEVKEAYEDAVNRELPLPVRELLVDQLAHIESSHDFVKAARDRQK